MSLGLGYDREKVIECLRAAFGNEDRAMQYLQTGIPSNLRQQTSSSSSRVPPSSSTGAPGTTGGSGGPRPGGTTGSTAPLPGDINPELHAIFSQITRNPQFEQIRNVLRSNPTQAPQILLQIITTLAQQNPELGTLIMNNQNTFIHALMNPSGGGGSGGRNMITLTPKEHDDVQGLIAFGFAKPDALEAYLACD